MDAKDCMMAIEQFIASPGMLSAIWSDNGTNFVSAEQDLLTYLISWATRLIALKLAYKRIKWKFSLPAVPHNEASGKH